MRDLNAGGSLGWIDVANGAKEEGMLADGGFVFCSKLVRRWIGPTVLMLCVIVDTSTKER